MSINHLQETPWWQQQSLMESTVQSSNSSPSSSHKFQASAAAAASSTPVHQQFTSWPSPHHHRQYYQQQHQQQQRLWLNSFESNENNNPSLSFISEQEMMTTNKNKNAIEELEQEHEPEPQKEAMFEKPLTPSDVGKLNRLVIPKQHAEKYFPLGGGDSAAEKGLLLSFEDESGKCWRFRYSYWNSSQSYVLTKGWSRYVKEKRLDAGDVIQFERHRTDTERLFIGWRRRGAPSSSSSSREDAHTNSGGAWPRGLYSSNHHHPAPYPVQTHAVTVPLYQHHAGGQTTSVGSSRTFRLFGVNLECQIDDESESQQAHQQQQFSYSVEAAAACTNRDNHMDITFSQDDENQMVGNRHG